MADSLGSAITMTEPELMDEILGRLRSVFWRCFPKASLLWRNGVLWQVAAYRRSIGLALFLGSALLLVLLQVLVLQVLLHPSGFLANPVVLQADLLQTVQSLKLQAQQLQLDSATRSLGISQKKIALNKLNVQDNERLAQWPNSALRMPLLSQLQVLAVQMGLKVMELKALPSPNAHGFESSRIQLQMKGTQQATYAYWQSLDRVFANGIWPSMSWVLQADGQYVLSAQLHLWWDVDDAYTDTGVEVRWHDELIKRAISDQVAVQLSAQTTAQSFVANAAHVFPDQSRMHMQLVGVGNGEQTTWALVKSGYQVLPVQMDQYLGSEKVKIKYANAQGLWGEVAEGVVQKLLTWEAGKP